MGLGFDDWDLDFYTKMFTEQLMRNPTDVECFDLGEEILLKLKQNAKFFDFLDENRLLFVVLSDRFQISSERKRDFGV